MMKTPAEIVLDLRRERIREAHRAIVADGGRPTARRIARDARLDVDVVVALLPTFGDDELDLVEDSELAAAA